jgi:predicted MFS family arabinose efflux permease
LDQGTQHAALSRKQEYALAATVGVVAANAYYIHPIIGEVARSFGVSQAAIGIVPALNQLALALGIFLLLPLGDRFSNKRLCLVFVTAQTLSMAGMALAPDFVSFTIASTLLGFFTIAPYLLPAFASRRVAPERLGHVTALLTTGIIAGLLIARVGAGFMTEYLGWRSVYIGASGLMLVTTLSLPISMRSAASPKAGAKRQDQPMAYRQLLRSVITLGLRHREIFVSAAIQALNFGMFTFSWLAMALYLTSDTMGYSVDSVGMLAGVAAIAVFSTPRIGRAADRIGPRKARRFLTLTQLTGACLFYPLGASIWTLIVPLLIMNLAGPGIDVTNRMTFLALAPDIRTRLTTVYVVTMFIGGGLGSILGTSIYAWGGWGAVCAGLLLASLVVAALAFYAERKFG